MFGDRRCDIIISISPKVMEQCLLDKKTTKDLEKVFRPIYSDESVKNWTDS